MYLAVELNDKVVRLQTLAAVADNTLRQWEKKRGVGMLPQPSPIPFVTSGRDVVNTKKHIGYIV
jgi:hypothetical protein